jgi:(p)ppGpp synthase/HD superfamily hydrolase
MALVGEERRRIASEAVSVQIAKGLAQGWMRGMRQGRPGDPHRPCWQHPEDLVRLLVEEYPGKISDGMLTVAWLHDIVEDGRKDDGHAVSFEDLRREDIRASYVNDIATLTKGPDESKLSYLSRLRNAPISSPRVRIVKCVDRICNLREGHLLFKDSRWSRYVGETYYFLLPLTEQVGGYEGEWLREKLCEAAALRPVR